jgi:preprotein translocase subunit SecE
MANPVNDLISYVRNSIAELKKVTWPTKQQTIRYSTMVVTVSVAVAVFFAVLDFGFSKLVAYTLTARTPSAQTETPAPADVVPTVEPTDIQVETVPIETPTETPAESTDLKLPLE